MTEREVLATAAAAILGAALAWAVPWWCLVGVGLAVLLARSPGSVAVLVLIASSMLAARAEAGLAAPHTSVAGLATVVMDPEHRPGGWVTELGWAGRRYRAFVPSAVAGAGGLSMGDVVSLSGRTSRLDAPWDWRRARHLAGRLRVRSMVRVGAGAWWWRLANGTRALVEDGLGSYSDADRSLFLGVVLGDDRGQTAVERFRFRSAGLSHLTAVSGQNVAYVMVAASPVLTRLRLHPRWSVTMALLAWFALVTRLEPSVLRAVAMAAVASTAWTLGRVASGLRVLGLAVVTLVLVDPLLVWSTGFRLSVVASGALLVGARPVAASIGGPRWWSGALAVPLVAQVATAPLLLPLGGSVPVLGLVANVLAVPVAGALMIWGSVAGPLAGALGGPLGVVLGWPSRASSAVLSQLAAWFGAPGLPRWGWVGTVGAGAALVGWTLVRRAGGRRRRRRVWWPLIGLGVIAVSADVVGAVPAGWGPERHVVGRGVELWSVGGRTVMEIGSGVAEDDALGALTRCRCGHLDLVQVTGGGRTAVGVVRSLQEVAEVDAVVDAVVEAPVGGG